MRGMASVRALNSARTFTRRGPQLVEEVLRRQRNRVFCGESFFAHYPAQECTMSSDWKSRPGGPRTIVDLLAVRAGDDPDRVAYRYLADGEVESARVTYAGLTQAAKAIAAALQEKNAIGERALLLFPPTLDFINAFMGC